MESKLSDEELAKLSIQAFAELGEDCPPVQIILDPHDAFVLAVNLPLIFQHPANQDGPPMEVMQKLFKTLQQVFEQRSSAAAKVIGLCGEQNPYLTESK